MKYDLTSDTIEYDGRTLYRIRALKSFGDVQKGDLGGFVAAERNLSQTDDAWVADDAQVAGNAQVTGAAWVTDDAKVTGAARVAGIALVDGDT